MLQLIILSFSFAVIRAQQIEAGGDSELIPDIIFPVEGDLTNFLLPENVTTPPAQITIPSSLISTINVTEGTKYLGSQIMLSPLSDNNARVQCMKFYLI